MAKPKKSDEQRKYDAARMASWRAGNPAKRKEAYRRSGYRKTFGIEVSVFEGLLEKQKGVCAICGNPESRLGNGGSIRRLSIDHCHTTGIIRGLLCYNCNTILGLAKDNQKVLQQAITYLSSADTGFRTNPSAEIPSVDELLAELMDNT